jgi:dTDP-4-dehydrorhamnose 3,5-epimerase
MPESKDVQSVTPEGVGLRPLLHEVVVRPSPLQVDERGELAEIWSANVNVGTEPVVHVYMTTIRPGKIKGWVMHKLQADRLFVVMGVTRWVLYDARADSPTHGQINDLVIGERNRAALRIPSGVFHAVQNLGTGEAAFVNLPTRPYDYADPDKYRLPLDTDQIPFRDWDNPGW